MAAQCDRCGTGNLTWTLLLRPSTLEEDRFQAFQSFLPQFDSDKLEVCNLCSQCAEKFLNANLQKSSKTADSLATLDKYARKIPLSEVFPLLGNMKDVEVVAELKKRFGLEGLYSRERIRQFRKKFGIPKLGSFLLPSRPGKLEKLMEDLKTLFNAEVMKKWGVSEAGLKGWRKELGISAPASGYSLPSMPIPEDFFENYHKLTHDQLKDRYRVSVMTLWRWASSFNMSKTYNEKIEIPEDFLERYYRYTNGELAQYYNVSIGMPAKWAKELGLVSKAKHRPNLSELGDNVPAAYKLPFETSIAASVWYSHLLDRLPGSKLYPAFTGYDPATSYGRAICFNDNAGQRVKICHLWNSAYKRGRNPMPNRLIFELAMGTEGLGAMSDEYRNWCSALIHERLGADLSGLENKQPYFNADRPFDNEMAARLLQVLLAIGARGSSNTAKMKGKLATEGPMFLPSDFPFDSDKQGMQVLLNDGERLLAYPPGLFAAETEEEVPFTYEVFDTETEAWVSCNGRLVVRDNVAVLETDGNDVAKAGTTELFFEDAERILVKEMHWTAAGQHDFQPLDMKVLPEATSEDMVEYPEGRIAMRLHAVRERNRNLIRDKRNSCKAKQGRLLCEVCGFDFESRYGDLGIDYVECHHLLPLALAGEQRTTRLDDLAVVCANCHRMFHRMPSGKSVADLKANLR